MATLTRSTGVPVDSATAADSEAISARFCSTVRPRTIVTCTKGIAVLPELSAGDLDGAQPVKARDDHVARSHRNGLGQRAGQHDLPRHQPPPAWRSEEHTSELQSRFELVCRLLLEKKKRGGPCGPPKRWAYRKTTRLTSSTRACCISPGAPLRSIFFLMSRRPPRPTVFPCTPLFR